MQPNYLFRVVFLLVFASVALTAQVARQESVVPLKNWAAPLYWQPSQAESEALPQRVAPQLQFSANAVSTNALTFVAITPCRLVDTRGGAFNGMSPFSGPSIASKGTITIPVQSPAEATANTAPAPCGAIPSIAEAYSFNLTVVPVAGGAVDFVTMWPAGSTQPVVATLDDPQGAIVSNAAIVPAGPSASPGYGGVSLYNDGPAATNVVIDMNGYYAAPTDLIGNTAVGNGTLASNTIGYNNTASGLNALNANTAGYDNTASGVSALSLNTTGNYNTAAGVSALLSNTTGTNNTADGVNALMHNINGSLNTASGADALAANTIGNNNTASGQNALASNTTGSNNTALGLNTLASNTIGSGNIAIGENAANGVSGGNGSNIHIGSLGLAGDSSVIRIGTQGAQTSAYIAGIYGGTPSTPNLPVCVDANGTLGTAGCSGTPSSRRFKEQIADMGDSSNKLLQLRPVTFLYKPQYDDGSHTLQYGLIAEEVAKLYPEMVGYDKDGQPSSVKYQSLTPMLLNEAQKQNARVEKLEEQNRKLEDRLAALEARLASQ